MDTWTWGFLGPYGGRLLVSVREATKWQKHTFVPKLGAIARLWERISPVAACRWLREISVLMTQEPDPIMTGYIHIYLYLHCYIYIFYLYIDISLIYPGIGSCDCGARKSEIYREGRQLETLRWFLHGRPHWDTSLRVQPPGRWLLLVPQVQRWVCAGQRLRVSSAGGHGLLCSPDPPGSLFAGSKLVAGCPWALLPLGSGWDPTPSCSSSHGRGSGKAQAARGAVEGGLPLPAGHRAAQGAPDCSWPPAPGPFFPLLFVQDLLIWEQGPFMWRWASPGLPVPPRAGDFLFIWR